MDNEKLKPCPFCGNDADDQQGFHDLIVIGCSVCETAQTQPFNDYAAAVRTWNQRDGDPCREGCKIKQWARESTENLSADF